jgi:hypothetical protein
VLAASIAEYVPAGQSVQDTAPTCTNWPGVGAYFPGVHNEQRLWPVDSVYLPEGQIEQMLSPLDEKVPVPQGSHVEVPLL